MAVGASVIEYAMALARAGSAAALAISLGTAPDAANRVGYYSDLTASAEKLGIVVGGITGPTFDRTGSSVVMSGVKLQDSTLQIVDQADITKSIAFQCASIGSGFQLTIDAGAQAANRTLSVPVLSASDTIATLGLANTFTQTNAFQTITATVAVIGTDPTGAQLLRVGGDIKATSFLASNGTLNTFSSFSGSASADQKYWVWQAGTSIGDGIFRLRAINDAESSGINALTFSRVGIASTAAAFGGNVSVAGTLTLSAMTSGRVPFFSSGGLMSSSTALNFATAPNGMLTIGLLATSGEPILALDGFGNQWQLYGSSATTFRLWSSGAGASYFSYTTTGKLTLEATTGTILDIKSTTDSTTKDTGSIVTEGGIGAEKAIYTGTILGVADTSTRVQIKVPSLTEAATAANFPRILLTDGSAGDIFSSAAGHIVIIPRTGTVARSFSVWTGVSTATEKFRVDGTGVVSCYDTTDSPTLTSNALYVAGGIGIADGKNINVGSTTGTKIGTATTQKLGLWNATPVIQPASANQAAVATTAATNIAPYGFTTAAQADGIITLLNEIRSALVTIGAIKGAA
jgi:hypothetical protein